MSPSQQTGKNQLDNLFLASQNAVEATTDDIDRVHQLHGVFAVRVVCGGPFDGLLHDVFPVRLSSECPPHEGRLQSGM